MAGIFETPEARMAEASPGLNDPKTQRIAQQVLQQLLRGLNAMQMQAGLAPGGGMTGNPFMGTTSSAAGGYSGVTPTRGAPPPMSPGDAATKARLEFTQHMQLQALQAPPPSFGGGVTPVSRPTAYQMAAFMPPPTFPGAQYGSPYNAIHQTQMTQVNQQLAAAQAVGGLAARHFGTAPMGIGALYAEHRGMGQAFQNMGMNMFQPLIHHRAATLQMQQASMQFYRGMADTNIGGIGLSASAAGQVVHGLDRMSDNAGFRQATRGMFNRQDLSRITDLASQMGMLGEARSADQITQAVGRISRGLSTFMRVAGQPDVQEAMRSMAQMHHLGMTVPEMGAAARNAARFARMAGTDTQTVMAQGMAGAGVFQQYGLSGGAGLRAGIAAAGMSPQLASLMGANRASLAGGAEGIQQTLMTGAAHSATINALLPAMLTRRGGHLAIDEEALRRMVSGDMTMSQMTREGASRIRQLGGRSAMLELSTRQSELQDEASRRMGGQLSTLMPLIQARALMQEHPGTFNLGGALRTLGFNEQQARTYEQMGNDPRFWESMRHSAQEEQRESRRAIAAERRTIAAAARMPQFAREGLAQVDRIRDRLDTGMEHVHEMFSRAQDMGEQRAMIEAEGGEVLRDASGGWRLGTEEGAAVVGRQLRTREGREAFRRTSAGALAAAQARIARDEQRQDIVAAYRRTSAGLALTSPLTLTSPGFTATAVMAQLMDPFIGGPNMGVFGPRGQTMRETVEGSDSLLLRGRRGLGFTPSQSGAVIEARAENLANMTGIIGRSGNLTALGQRDQAREVTRLSSRVLGTADDRAGRHETTRHISAAATALSSYLSERGRLGGALVHGEATPEGMQAAMRQGFINSGMSTEQADQMMASPAVQQQIVEATRNRQDPTVNRALDRVEERGGNVSTSGGARTAAALRANATDATRGALSKLGIDTGFFGVSEAQQRRVSSALTGTGRAGEARRLALGIAAARAAGNHDQADQLENELRSEYSAEEAATARAAIEGAEFEAATLEGLGASIAGMGTDTAAIAGFLGDQGQTLQRAQVEAANANIAEAVGGASGAMAAFTGGASSLAAFVQGGGNLANATSEEMTAMREGSQASRERAAQRYIDRTTAAATGNTRVTGLTGTSEGANARGDSFLGAVTDSLGAFFGMNQEAGALTPAEAAAGEGAGPADFGEAVVTFNRASERMLHAAELMEASSTTGQLGMIASGAASAAGTVGRGILSIITAGAFTGAPPRR